MMNYTKTVKAIFKDRPNRFIAHVELEGRTETVHVKNTGRCRELLIPGAEVVLERSDSPKRKTAYDLVMVRKEGLGWVNIDSQAPNTLAAEWLRAKGYDLIKPEYRYGDSRIDFYMEKDGERYLMEVKGCTLEVEGIGYFPDAPTQRGAKHLRELIRAAAEGCHCSLAFVIQMNGINTVLPNTATDPDFASALAQAQAAGVELHFIRCRVEEDRVEPLTGEESL